MIAFRQLTRASLYAIFYERFFSSYQTRNFGYMTKNEKRLEVRNVLHVHLHLI